MMMSSPCFLSVRFLLRNGRSNCWTSARLLSGMIQQPLVSTTTTTTGFSRLPFLHRHHPRLCHTAATRCKEKLECVYLETRRAIGSIISSGHSILPNSDENDLKVFDDTFSIVLRSLLSKEDDEDGGDALNGFIQHFKKVIEYNVPYGKKFRGLATVAAYRMLHENPKLITKEEVLKASLMGWCIEMFQAFYLVTDDIMDQSLTRRGKLCWYRNEQVGLSAFNDALLIQGGMFKILKNIFSSLPYYHDVVELFNELYWKTNLGQTLDMLRTRRENEKIDFTKFTIENYSVMIKYKTSYYSFYLPIALALHMHGVSDKNIHSQARSVLLDMGHLFQIQDDFLDCFGKPTETGKLGTDIAEGKCSWLVVKALELANYEQIKIIMNNYGQRNSDCVQRICDLFLELNLPSVYADYEQTKYEQIVSAIQSPSFSIPENVFNYCLSLIYKRRS